MSHRVLIVEDDQQLAGIVALLLKPLETEVVHTLGDAIARVREAPTVDCVLLDLKLPNSKGIKTVLDFKASAPETPLVVMSGQDIDPADVKAAGAFEFVQKPVINMDVLVVPIGQAIVAKKTLKDSGEQVQLIQEIKKSADDSAVQIGKTLAKVDAAARPSRS